MEELQPNPITHIPILWVSTQKQQYHQCIIKIGWNVFSLMDWDWAVYPRSPNGELMLCALFLTRGSPHPHTTLLLALGFRDQGEKEEAEAGVWRFIGNLVRDSTGSLQRIDGPCMSPWSLQRLKGK